MRSVRDKKGDKKGRVKDRHAENAFRAQPAGKSS